MSEGIRAMWMRGGTSKGGYFLADDLPSDAERRDALLLRIMGSPDIRQIDGMGGADPLTSKVAVIRKSARPGIDVDYLFLQVSVDRPTVSSAQNCGNILAGVGPFSIERGIVRAGDGTTRVSIHMENSSSAAAATVITPDRIPVYAGSASIDGVPGTAAPVSLEFQNIAGSACGKLLPTGNAADAVDGMEVTMIDNGMPCVIIAAREMGISGAESPDRLESDTELKERLERLRLQCGRLMGLGDVRNKSIPKMTLVSPPFSGGTVSTRTFIPHRCHKAIGVFGAITVGTACLLPEGPAQSCAGDHKERERLLAIEHPGGSIQLRASLANAGAAQRIGMVSTARKLFDGRVYPD